MVRLDAKMDALAGKIDVLGSQMAQLRSDLGGEIVQVRQDLGAQMIEVLNDSKSRARPSCGSRSPPC